MVDWKNENTLATPSIDINRVQILERRAYVIESLEEYYRYASAGSIGRKDRFISRLISLFFEIQGTIYRHCKDNQDSRSFKEIKEILFPIKGQKHNMDKCIEVWEQINLLLDTIKLTPVDTKKEYDSRDIEAENDTQGL